MRDLFEIYSNQEIRFCITTWRHRLRMLRWLNHLRPSTSWASEFSWYLVGVVIVKVNLGCGGSKGRVWDEECFSGVVCMHANSLLNHRSLPMLCLCCAYAVLKLFPWLAFYDSTLPTSHDQHMVLWLDTVHLI